MIKNWHLPLSVTIHAVAFLALQWGSFFKPPVPKGLALQQGNTVIVQFVQKKTSSKKQIKSSPLTNNQLQKNEFVLRVPRKTPQVTAPLQKNKKLGRAEGSVKKGELAGNLGHKNGRQVSSIEQYGYELRQYIKNSKVYPTFAKRMRIEGEVLIEFNIHATGKIAQPTIKQGSNHPRLDKAAKNLIVALEGFKPFPKEITSKQLTFTIPIEYKLE